MIPYALIGPSSRREEFLQRAQVPEPNYVGESPPSRQGIHEYRLIIDLALDEAPERMALYAYRPEQAVLGCAVRQSLYEMAYEQNIPVRGPLLGLNSLPTFLDRPVWEVSLYREEDHAQVAELEAWLGVEVQVVPDQVGMVTPRTLFMVINEAYQVMQEGTASEADIDLAMQLGTNYPQGPIAWSRQIGLEHIATVIERLRATTGEGRYRVSPMLRRAAMLTER